MPPIKARAARRLSISFAIDTLAMLRMAAKVEGVSVTQYVREAAIFRASITLHRARTGARGRSVEDLVGSLLARVARLEQQLGRKTS